MIVVQSPELLERAKAIAKIIVGVGKNSTKNSKARKEKEAKKLGFILEHFFGKPRWTLKDLNDEELMTFINLYEAKAEKRKARQAIINTEVLNGPVSNSQA